MYKSCNFCSKKSMQMRNRIQASLNDSKKLCWFSGKDKVLKKNPACKAKVNKR